MKQCSKCKEMKLLVEFGHSKSQPDKRHGACLSCEAKRFRIKRSTPKGKRENNFWASRGGKRNPTAAAARAATRRTKKTKAGGKHTAKDRKFQWKRQAHRCHCCQRLLESWRPKHCHYDHWISVNHLGTSNPSNMRILCGPCNLSKNARTLGEWQADMPEKFTEDEWNEMFERETVEQEYWAKR